MAGGSPGDRLLRKYLHSRSSGEHIAVNKYRIPRVGACFINQSLDILLCEYTCTATINIKQYSMYTSEEASEFVVLIHLN